jgi:uncharacterized protein YdeI (YjbR/CyaY-like superfamily)
VPVLKTPPVFFESAAEFRSWLSRNHASASEVWVGFYKKDSGQTGITYRDALDEALCFGWIDGVRKKVDPISYTNRFSPRKPRSYWSEVNTRRVAELTEAGRMDKAGLDVFAKRDVQRTEQYSFERKNVRFDPAIERRFRANAKAWRYFSGLAPSYRRTVTWWVMSAKKEETRWKRLEVIIAKAAEGRRMGVMVADDGPAGSSSSSASSSRSSRSPASRSRKK